MENKNRQKNSFDWRSLIAGTAGGVASTAVFHPLELIKIRWQVYEAASLKKLKFLDNPSKDKLGQLAPSYRPKYRGLFDTVLSVYKNENGIRGLYRGLGINTLASGSAWGLYFLVYNGLKARHDKKLTISNYTLDATIAGVSIILVTNPLFLIKTRMCLQYSEIDKDVGGKVVKYKNTLEALRTIVRNEGFLGLYTGFIPGLFGTLNGTIQMVSYDLMKSWWTNYFHEDLNTVHFSTFSGLSKIIAVVCTYPFQLVRARLQDQHQNYKNFFDVLAKTYRNERIYGFYKGLIPCLVRVTPAASLTFIVYENLLNFLKTL
ncbi:unnamed protein product [Brachionus calyciflorus]|uniref:Uncharacterized protein n=1 Tax=Brachionus calyciflorus TaxID=104777 RepID=A0A813M4U6_9BILA|nr:unnamed protein product [Brachionus calyciflorus]